MKRFLDVTKNKKQNPSAGLIAQEIRKRIFEEVGLTASTGISINKFIAKVASDINKPNGQTTITPEEVFPFLEQLPIEKFFGVGKVTASKMHKLGLYNGFDLKQKEKTFLIQHFGKSGNHFYNIVRGIHNSQVQPNRIRKSISAENTFLNDLSKLEEILDALHLIAVELENRLIKNQVKGRTLTLKIKYNDFTQQTRSKTKDFFIDKKEDFFPIVQELLNGQPLKMPVRLFGIGMSNLNNNQKDTDLHQPLLFS